MDTGDFAWLAYPVEDDAFDVTEFMSRDQSIFQHNVNAYPLSYVEPEQAQGENSQCSGHGLDTMSARDSTSNISSSPSMSTPELPALAKNQSPKIQTATKSPTRNSTMSGISAPHHRFTCQLCSFSTNTKRDYTRHLATRKHRNNANIGLEGMDEGSIGFLCPVPDCKYSASAATGGEMMFSREDNFWRHIRKVHKIKKQRYLGDDDACH